MSNRAKQDGRARYRQRKLLRLRRLKAEANGPTEAPRCKCEKPATYRDEDGDRRCICGRAV